MGAWVTSPLVCVPCQPRHPSSSLGLAWGTAQERHLHLPPVPTRATHQDGRNHQRLIGQCLRQVDVQGGGVHRQGPVGVPHPDLRQRGHGQHRPCLRRPQPSGPRPALPRPQPHPGSGIVPGNAHLTVALPRLLQDAQGVVGPLPFAVELDPPSQPVILYLAGREEGRGKGGRGPEGKRQRWRRRERGRGTRKDHS